MKSIERILELIDKGDPIPILAEDSLVEAFNELLKHELINIIDDRVVLTSKGEEARSLGFEKIITELKLRDELKDFSVEVQKKELHRLNWSFGICLLLLIFFVTISLTECNNSF